MAVAILISAVVSLTLTPMLCARLLRHQPQAEASRPAPHAAGAAATPWPGFSTGDRRYGRCWTGCWTPQADLAGVPGHAGGHGAAVLCRAQGLFPEQDTGTIAATTEADQSISFAAMAERQQALAELLKDPAVQSVSSFIGVDGSNTTLNTGRIQIDLKPRPARRLPVVLRRLGDAAAQVPGIRLYAQPVQDLTIEDRQARTQYQLLLSSPDMPQLETSTQALVERLRSCRSCWMWQRPAEPGPPGLCADRPRPGQPPGVTVPPWTRRSTTPSASG
jgi:multidrug efflux pump